MLCRLLSCECSTNFILVRNSSRKSLRYHVNSPEYHVLWTTQTWYDEIFFLFLNVDMVVGNSALEEFVCIRQGKRVGIIAIEIERRRIHFSCEVSGANAAVVS